MTDWRRSNGDSLYISLSLSLSRRDAKSDTAPSTVFPRYRAVPFFSGFRWPIGSDPPSRMTFAVVAILKRYSVPSL